MRGVRLLIYSFIFVSAVGIGGGSCSRGQSNPILVPLPHETRVNFVILTQKGNLVAYVYEGKVHIDRVGFGAAEPYMQIPKKISDGDSYEEVLGHYRQVPKGEWFIHWGGFTTLFVKDLEQLNSLILK